MSAEAGSSSDKNQKRAVSKPGTKKLYSLTRKHYTFLAGMILLSATGMVRPQEFAFVIFSVIYMYFLSMVAFPVISHSTHPPLFTATQLKMMGVYVVFISLIGLYLPIAYITQGFFLGDKDGIKAAVPHLFLLLSQLFVEGVGFSDKFPLPIRVYVPVVYNSARIFTLLEWLRNEFSKENNGGDGISTISAVRIYIGRSIAVANMLLWCFNLFGFLLPVWLPKILKVYYSSPAVLHKVKT